MSIKNIFTNEEALYINGLLQGERLQKQKKEDILNKIAFAREAAPEDDDIYSLIQDTYSKIKELTGQQWETLKKIFPLDSNFDQIDVEA